MKRLLLVGAGHAHAQVLKDWIAAPLPGVELVVVSPSALAPYSGMVPGWLAGRYGYDEICIDFETLAAAAGAHFIEGALAALNAERHQVRLVSGAVLDYDVLSLNVGSTLNPPALEGTHVLPLRPLGGLRRAWDALLAELAPAADRPLAITTVGGGAAGVESMLAVLARLRALQPSRALAAVLVSRGESLLPGLPQAAARSAQAALTAAGVELRLGSDFNAGNAPAGGVLLWAAGAEAHAWQRECGLAVGASGFVRVDKCLRSLLHPEVHAVGDCAEWAPPLPKAGVYAVRMGPVLSRNLRAALGVGAQACSPRAYLPQRRVLALLATADGRAIASWGPGALRGRWVWRWKDRIDRTFVQRFVVNPVLQIGSQPARKATL